MDHSVQELLEAVNDAEGEDAYGLEVSPRLGRNKAKEQYAFFYRKGRFTLARSKTYDDPEDVFEREPFAAQFKTRCVEEGGGDAGETDIVLVGIHTQVRVHQSILCDFDADLGRICSICKFCN